MTHPFMTHPRARRRCFPSRSRLLQQTTAFVNTGYGLATEEAERIGIDHVAKVSGSTGPSTSSEVTLHLSTHRSAMEMMRERIVIIRNYLQVNSLADR